jgi:hypothetical protein
MEFLNAPGQSKQWVQIRRVCRLLSIAAGTLALLVSAPDISWAAFTRSGDCSDRHPTSGAWWTGPMLANTAATAPRGHLLLESYLYDDTVQGSFAASGTRQSAPHANQYGSLTYIVYALTDRVGVGLIPTAGYNQLSDGPNSTGVDLGDWTLQAQRRLTSFEPCTELPTVSVAVQETVPTGKFDKLGDRPSDGLGAGAWTTNLALYTQTWFWLPNHRIVRMRLNLSDAVSGSVKLQDVSVYGTAQGFRGTVRPGSSFYVDAAWELSLTRRWVLASDLIYRNNENTRVTGYNALTSQRDIVMNSGSSGSWGFAPAVEYSWKPTIGVLVGTRVIAGGRNASATITPAIAINFVH